MGTFLASVTASAMALPVVSSEPPPVRAIELRGNLRVRDLEAFRQLLAIEVGQPMSERAVRRTLTNLLASGLTSEVEVRSRPASGGGVVAVVVAWGAVQVEEVRLEGELGLPRRQLQAVLPQGRGQPLFESRVVSGVFRLIDLYQAEGYRDARVIVEVSFLDAGHQQALVVYRVTSGRRSRIGEVSFTGPIAPFDRAELIRAMASRPGRHYRHKVVLADAERLRDWLLMRDYRTAQVEDPTEEYDALTGLVDLGFEIELGPKVRVEVIGADLKALTKKDLLTFMGRQGYDEALLFEAVERVRQYYQARGHYDAVVEHQQEAVDGETRVRLHVDPGALWSLEGLYFEGNSQFSASQLVELMETTSDRLFGLKKGRLVDEILAADLENLQAFYALEGFLDAQVGPPRVDRHEGRLVVTVPVVEGVRRQVARLLLKGSTELSWEEFETLVNQRGLLRSGGPYHPLLLEETVDVTQAWYRDSGWSSSRVSSQVRWNAAGTLAEVTLEIDTGPRTLSDQLIVRGNYRTQGSVIRRALALEPDQPLSRARQLDLQRRLYRLGVFSRVEVDLAPAEPGATHRDVVVRLEEGKTRRVSYGIGYDTDDGARGLLGYSNSNLGGKAYTLRADLRLSDRDQRFRLAFDQPTVGTQRAPLTYSLFYVRENRDPFRGQRWGGRIESSWKLSKSWRLAGRYEYRIVEPDDPTNSTAARENQQIRISSVAPSLLWETRNDLVNPSRGGSGFYQLEYAFDALGTNEAFTKFFVQQTQVVDLGRSGVLAASLRLGAIEPRKSRFGDLVVPPELGNSQVAISERFFAGGPTTHRAFRVDELGLDQRTLFDGQPAGGNALVLLNLDFRFPLAGPLGGLFFFDAGNVWAEPGDFEFDDLRPGAGFGLSYLSPIGPLQIGVGWKLDREPGEDGARVFVSVGHPF